MNARIRTILVSMGTFVGVLLVMCLVAKVMMQDAQEQPSGYEQALNKLSGDETDEKAKDAPKTDNDKANESKTPDKNDVNVDAGTVTGTENEPGRNDPEGSEANAPDNNTDNTQSPETGSDNPEEDDNTKTPTSGKRRVVINAAHQSKDNNETEPNGPGASQKSRKAHVGATGVSSGTPEYKVNLAIAKYLRDELEARGYEVYMIRESNDVDISDSQRAVLANENGDIVLHIHCNADDAEGIKGIMAFYPSKDNPYAGKYSDACLKLSQAVLKGLGDATGDKSWGAIALDTQATLNWSTIPATHVEVGYLSNPDEDFLLQTDSYRHTIAEGLADGIDLYFIED